MTKRPASSEAENGASFTRQIGAQAVRKLRGRRDPAPGVWFGLGMMGLVGWSVVVPTLAGASLGVWLDRHRPGQHSWTLALLMAGLCLGCFNAWCWVVKEEKAIQDQAIQDQGRDDND